MSEETLQWILCCAICGRDTCFQHFFLDRLQYMGYCPHCNIRTYYDPDAPTVCDLFWITTTSDADGVELKQWYQVQYALASGVELVHERKD